MEYRGLERIYTDKPWAKFVATADEIETSKIGYLVAGKPEALEKFPAGGGGQHEGLYLGRENARHIVVGNIMLMNQLSVSPDVLVDSGVFDDVSEFVRSGVAALELGALEEASPSILEDAIPEDRQSVRGMSN